MLKSKSPLALLMLLPLFFLLPLHGIAQNTNSRNNTTTEQQDAFQEFWDIYDRHYALFHRKNIDWQNIYDTYSPQVTASTTDEQLFNLLSEIITTVIKDGHTDITYDGEATVYDQEASAVMQNMLANDY